MTRLELLQFMRAHRYAVQASIGPSDSPQAAVVGIAVGDDFGIVFDTIDRSRKAQNLRRHQKIALVIGGAAEGDERTVQYEGVADEPRGADLERARALYFARFPDGRDRLTWQGLIHVRVTPRWIRYSDFKQNPPAIVEFTSADLQAKEGRST